MWNLNVFSPHRLCVHSNCSCLECLALWRIAFPTSPFTKVSLMPQNNQISILGIPRDFLKRFRLWHSWASFSKNVLETSARPRFRAGCCKGPESIPPPGGRWGGCWSQSQVTQGCSFCCCWPWGEDPQLCCVARMLHLGPTPACGTCFWPRLSRLVPAGAAAPLHCSPAPPGHGPAEPSTDTKPTHSPQEGAPSCPPTCPIHWQARSCPAAPGEPLLLRMAVVSKWESDMPIVMRQVWDQAANTSQRVRVRIRPIAREEVRHSPVAGPGPWWQGAFGWSQAGNLPVRVPWLCIGCNALGAVAWVGVRSSA